MNKPVFHHQITYRNFPDQHTIEQPSDMTQILAIT